MKIISGTKFNDLIFIKEIKKRGNSGHVQCLCKCVCENIVIKRKASILNGNVKSCGCLSNIYKSESNKKHGMYKTKLYGVWSGMRGRTSNTNKYSWSYKYYKNISLCNEWKTFEGFYYWAKDKYKEGLEIDRIDNKKGYYPNNCRFVTRSENAQNTRKSCQWILFGKKFNSTREAANYFNVNRGRIHEWCVGKKDINKPIKQCYREFNYR